MIAVKVLPKGQITLPKKIRQKLRIQEGEHSAARHGRGASDYQKREDHFRLQGCFAQFGNERG